MTAKKATKLYVTWRSTTGSIVPVGLLTKNVLEGSVDYEFRYVEGARSSDFHPLPGFPEIGKTYESKTLFPLFANRLMPRSRSDYQGFLKALALTSDDEPFTVLARSEGKKHTDRIEVFPCPSRDQANVMNALFFARGIRHIPGAAEAASTLEEGEMLQLVDDHENPANPRAILMCASSSKQIGWVADYLLGAIHEIRERTGSQVAIFVHHLNDENTPSYMRLLCRLEAPWPEGFEPFSSREFQPVVSPLVPG